MIGLESNIITIDIHESKVPLNLQPEFVSIYHDEKLVHSGKISYNDGNVKIDIGESKKNFENIFESAGRYIPFSFHFLAYSRKTIIFNKGMYALGEMGLTHLYQIASLDLTTKAVNVAIIFVGLVKVQLKSKVNF